MRFVITGFLALLLWGYASFSAGDVGLPKWIPAVCLAVIGLIVQLVYARLVNRHFNHVGMPESIRVRLRDDRRVVPFWIAGMGIIARSLMLAGTVFPLLEAIGCIVRGTSSV
jgi:dipeptide/tripeptide permease